MVAVAVGFGMTLAWLEIMIFPVDQESSSEPVSKPAPFPDCDEKNWSAGEVFFMMFVIVSTYFLQPRGSFAFLEAGRIWRLSPLFALLETIWTWVWIFEGLASGRYFRATCAALLTTRVTMSRHLEDFKDLPEPVSPITPWIMDWWKVWLAMSPQGRFLNYISGIEPL